MPETNYYVDELSKDAEFILTDQDCRSYGNIMVAPATFYGASPPLAVRDRLNGEIPMLDAESLLVIEEAAAPGVEIVDLVHVDGKLWHVRSALGTAGSVTLQLMDAQRADISVDGEAVTAYLAGDAGDGGPIVGLAEAGVLRRSDVVDVDGTAYRVGTPTVWLAADLRRFALTPV